MNDLYKIKFNVKNFERYEKIEGLKGLMENELIRVYNIYAEKANNGVTDKLNKEFKDLYPNYFKDNKDKEWYELNVYNKFMADGYQRLIVNDLNLESPLLNFYVDPDEIVFTGHLKWDREVTIDFYMMKN